MNKFTELLNVQLLMIIYILIGVLCRKLKIINEKAQSCLITLALNIILPCKVFYSIVEDMSEINVRDSLETILVSAVVVLLGYFIALLVYRKAAPGKKPSLELACMSTNSAFVGIPIAQSAFGATGVYYTTIYMTVAVIFFWTLGLSRYTKGEKGNALKKALLTPTTDAVILAVIASALGFHVPKIISPIFEEMSASSTMMCMIPIGYMVADIRFDTLKDKDVWTFSAMRLIILPLITLALLRLAHVDKTIADIIVLLVSAPAPILAAMFAAKHGRDSVFATAILIVTTVLALLTVPLLTLIYF